MVPVRVYLDICATNFDLYINVTVAHSTANPQKTFSVWNQLKRSSKILIVLLALPFGRNEVAHIYYFLPGRNSFIDHDDDDDVG